VDQQAADKPGRLIYCSIRTVCKLLPGTCIYVSRYWSAYIIEFEKKVKPFISSWYYP
jgi:hypothetical protein